MISTLNLLSIIEIMDRSLVGHITIDNSFDMIEFKYMISKNRVCLICRQSFEIRNSLDCD